MTSFAERLELAMKGPPKRTQAALARAVGIKPPSVKDWLTGRSQNPAGVNVLKAAAFLGVSAEWLADGRGPMRKEAPAATMPQTRDSESALLPITNAAGSMGYGAAQPDQDMIVDTMRVTKSWVRTSLPNVTSLDSLAILTAYGDSMEPTFSDGDLVLVDRGVHEVKLDAIYVLERHNELFIKRVRRNMQDGSLMIQSDNQLFGPPERVENGERENLHVLGRVVWAWRGKKL